MLRASTGILRCLGAGLTTLAPREMQTTSRRTGVIAIKAGMTQEWDAFGAFVPLTVLWIDNCQVETGRVRSEEKECAR